ncbi:hypothetical protein FXO37_15244 [Capsicum annuum]|nr:hypothetical protein FXO37_15244 [Capsicum annuum]
MRRCYMDDITLVQYFGKPDIFLTMTCNPSWPEIKEQLLSIDEAQNMPDLISRVFKAKVKEMKTDILKRHIFGKVAAFISKGFIELTTTSSGVAASILPGGRTVHSRFKIRVNVDEKFSCNISKQGSLASLIRQFPKDAKTFVAIDETVERSDQSEFEDFLHSLNPPGLPPYKLTLKENCPIMLLRNLNPCEGLCIDEVKGRSDNLQLRDWLELSLNHSVPSSLLILSRAFTVSGKVKPEEAIQATFSSLPDEVVDAVQVTSMPSEDSLAEKKRKLEFLEMDEELIKVKSCFFHCAGC